MKPKSMEEVVIEETYGIKYPKPIAIAQALTLNKDKWLR